MNMLARVSTDRRLRLVWALLLALTFGSFAVGIEQSVGFARAAAIIIVGIAMVKVRLIGIHFMDLRRAPRPLRLLFEGYTLVLFIVLTMLDLTVRP